MCLGHVFDLCSHGYNVLAMGQHLDDLAESFVMSAFNVCLISCLLCVRLRLVLTFVFLSTDFQQNGCLRTMKANYHNEYIKYIFWRARIA